MDTGQRIIEALKRTESRWAVSHAKDAMRTGRIESRGGTKLVTLAIDKATYTATVQPGIGF